MTVREYILKQVEKTRDTMRSDSFSHLGPLTIALRGKKLSTVLEILGASPKAPLELIDPAAVTGTAVEHVAGEIVGAENAFLASDPIVWEEGRVFFETKDGSLCTPDEYRYLKENTLVDRAVFGASRHEIYGLTATFKRIVRAAAEARGDKAKDILYLTAGSAHWIDKKKSTKTHIHRSIAPLFVMHIDAAGTGNLSVRQSEGGIFFAVNTVFRRDIIGQYEADIYEDIGDAPLSAKQITEAIEKVALRAEALLGDRIRIEKEDVFITLLDSQLEAICQKIEGNADALAASPLAALLAGETASFPEREHAESAFPPIYPLSADESQRAVIDASLAGKSVFASAPAGTGKSQTAVNIAANTVLRGGSVFVLSEKLAANDVFLHYSERIGLSPFCLTVDNRMSFDSLIRAVERVAALPRRYVKPDAASLAVEAYRRSAAAYERLNTRLYHPIETLGGASLYDMIALASSSAPLSHTEGLTLDEKDYRSAQELLSELDTGLLSQMSDEEYEAYFMKGESGDGELDALLTRICKKLLEKNINCKELFAKNRLSRVCAVERLRAQMARELALSYVEAWGLADTGERSVRKIFGELYENALAQERLYADLLTQALSERAKEAPTSELLSLLTDAKHAKLSVGEFFRENADKLRAVFPIVVSTPVPAVNYLYGTGLDRFTVMTVDEASQMPIVAILPFLDRVERLVVFGDEKQLAIINTFAKQEKVVSDDYEEKIASAKSSVLDAVRGRESMEGFFAGALRYHYRSKTEMLVHVSNERCYNGSLQVVPDVATSRRFLKPYMGLSLVEVADKAHPPEILRGGENETEAQAIVRDVIALRERYPEHSVGIITLNEKQQDLILDKLEEAGVDTEGDLWVRSLDNAQGKEADFIFISIAHAERNENGELRLAISTFNREGGENRLNVLFTRAAYRAAVYISFDYKELLRSNNPNIRLLYEYLHYAQEGEINERPSLRLPTADEGLLSAVATLTSTLVPTLEGKARIGSESVSVDVAVKEKDAEQYALGLLMPASGQSAVAAVTKMMTLFRAGWSLLPLSPTYFLSHPALFTAQLEKSLKAERQEKRKSEPTFLTSRAPKELFTPEMLEDKLFSEKPLADKDVPALHLDRIYGEVLREGLMSMEETELARLTRGGDKEALLASLVRYLPYYAEQGSLQRIISGVNSLYVVSKERRAGLLLAVLLRNGPSAEEPATRRVIADLLAEAKELGLGH